MGTMSGGVGPRGYILSIREVSAARCSRCQRLAPGYDCLPERRWLFVPLWGIPTYFATRRDAWSVPSMGSWWSIFPGATANAQ